MGGMDADTIGLIVLAAVLMIFFVAVQRQQAADARRFRTNIDRSHPATVRLRASRQFKRILLKQRFCLFTVKYYY
jgi:hypothetical protein